ATKAELREELKQYATKADLERALEIWAGALRAELASKAELAEFKSDVTAQLASVRADVIAEIRTLTLAVQESTATHFTVLDDKYRDLPARVTRLESKVFPPRRARRR